MPRPLERRGRARAAMAVLAAAVAGAAAGAGRADSLGAAICPNPAAVAESYAELYFEQYPPPAGTPECETICKEFARSCRLRVLNAFKCQKEANRGQRKSEDQQCSLLTVKSERKSCSRAAADAEQMCFEQARADRSAGDEFCQAATEACRLDCEETPG